MNFKKRARQLPFREGRSLFRRESRCDLQMSERNTREMRMHCTDPSIPGLFFFNSFPRMRRSRGRCDAERSEMKFTLSSVRKRRVDCPHSRPACAPCENGMSLTEKRRSTCTMLGFFVVGIASRELLQKSCLRVANPEVE
jgi:hypothetical protein